MNQNDSKLMVCTPFTEFIIFITLYYKQYIYKQYILPCYQEEFKALKAKVEEIEKEKKNMERDKPKPHDEPKAPSPA